MELSRRSSRILSRLFRTPTRVSISKTIADTATKEEVNSELLSSFNQDIQRGGAVPVFRRALLFPTRVALQDELGIYTYAGLYQAASVLCTEISTQLVGETERTIAYMCSNDASHVIVQWAIWMSGNIAVPLTPLHPPEMLKYFLGDSSASLVICTQEYERVLRPITLEISKPLLITGREKEITAQLYQPNSAFLKPKADNNLSDVGRSNEWYGGTEALIIYTSGTTSKPKGVVWTHSMLQTQIAALHSAWQYSSSDVVLHTLPLHHIHGQLNSMLASLAAGARIRMLPTFVSHTVWSRFLGMGERDEAKVTVFHGVPAMYARLASDHERMFADPRTAEYVRSALASRMRLMCAGSAPLPDTLFHKWEKISGMRLLERYGMSEAGMALSNPYRPVEARAVGCVGAPLPGLAARVAAGGGGSPLPGLAARVAAGGGGSPLPGLAARVAAGGGGSPLQPLVTVTTPLPETQISLHRLGLCSSKDVFAESAGYEWGRPTVTVHQPNDDNVYQGELLLKGPAVFTRYWNRAPKLDSTDFTTDGWFRTGDTVLYAGGKFKILGRTSVDIIKTAGYKVSALQVESAILEHPSVADVAVLGIENEDFGEIVAAVVVLKENAELTLEQLQEMASEKLAPYQIPRTMLIVDQMPRNAMGKLDKKEIRRLFGEKLVLTKN